MAPVGPRKSPERDERFDTDAGLQYLNARYYDPALGLFTSPDWWEVTQSGVGTNRSAYAGGDPVNLMDPGGNSNMSPQGQAQLRSFLDNDSNFSVSVAGLWGLDPNKSAESYHRDAGSFFLSDSFGRPSPEVSMGATLPSCSLGPLGCFGGFMVDAVIVIFGGYILYDDITGGSIYAEPGGSIVYSQTNLPEILGDIKDKTGLGTKEVADVLGWGQGQDGINKTPEEAAADAKAAGISADDVERLGREYGKFGERLKQKKTKGDVKTPERRAKHLQDTADKMRK